MKAAIRAAVEAARVGADERQTRRNVRRDARNDYQRRYHRGEATTEVKVYARSTRKAALLVVAVAGCLGAQTAAFLPQTPVRSVVPWSVAVCSATPADVPVGILYGAMADAGVSPCTYSGAVDALTKAQATSIPARIVKYAGYAATGMSVLLTVKVVQATPAYQQGAQIAANVFGNLIPLAQKDIPSVSGLLTQIARDSDVIRVPAGGCVVTTIIGPTGKAFRVDLKAKEK